MDDQLDDEWLPRRVWLIDQTQTLVDAWKTAFADFQEVTVVAGDYFHQPADAIVSPANSFGIMDGGLDLAIRHELGYGIQGEVQRVVVEKYHGEMPVGAAEVVPTQDARWKYLVAAPTMRVPEPVAYTLNAYLAFRAVLIAIENFNRERGQRAIDSLVCCGLATGIGAMPAVKCATQMRIAYKTMIEPAMIRRFESIHALHQALKMA